jgi:DNA invertase Pin-like site-specific DNA recombinase
MQKAISYIRFSTPEQSKGASLTRQSEGAANLCASKGWILLEKTYRDLGVSAYAGNNSSKGELGTFIRAVEDGEIEAGVILIVENLDRLSREAVPEAFTQFVRILNLGVEIYTLFDNQHYTKERISKDTATILMSILFMVRAHEESSTKSIRIKDALRRKKTTKKIWASKYPHWLEIKDDTFIVKEYEASVIRKIFELYLLGYGSVMIARIMNEQFPRVPLMKNGASKWSPSLILIYLKNPAVIGTLVPNDETQPWSLNYYPSIILNEDFYLVQNKLGGPRNIKKTNVGNLMTFHCVCGSSVKIMGAATEKRDGRYLRCEAAIVDKCSSETIRYAELERHLMETLNSSEVGHDVPVPDKSSKKLELDVVNAQITNLSAAIAMLPNPEQIPILVNQLAALQQQANSLTREMQTTVPKTSLSKKFQRFRAAYKLWLTDEQNNEYRLNLRSCALDLVSKVEIDLTYEFVGKTEGRFYFVHGEFKGAQTTIPCFVPMKKIRSYTRRPLNTFVK